MPELIVEDGSGVAGANSYVSVDQADLLIDARGYGQQWQATGTTDKERALLTAAELLNALDWKGNRSTNRQGGAWPRVGMVTRYGDGSLSPAAVPVDIQKAQAYFARRLAQRDLQELADQSAVLSSSSAGKSRALAMGHPARSVYPDEIYRLVGPFVHLNTARMVPVG